MSSYTAIARVSETMIKKLQDLLVPGLIRNTAQIGLCSPADRESANLGVFLYDIQESEMLRTHAMHNLSNEQQQFPPIYLELYYMLTVYPDGDLRFRYVQEEQIIGKIIQYFHDFPVMESQDAEYKIELQRMSTEDKIKLWSFHEQPYKLSVFYKAAPVQIESGRIKTVHRVRSVEIHADRV